MFSKIDFSIFGPLRVQIILARFWGLGSFLRRRLKSRGLKMSQKWGINFTSFLGFLAHFYGGGSICLSVKYFYGDESLWSRLGPKMAGFRGFEPVLAQTLWWVGSKWAVYRQKSTFFKVDFWRKMGIFKGLIFSEGTHLVGSKMAYFGAKMVTFLAGWAQTRRQFGRAKSGVSFREWDLIWSSILAKNGQKMALFHFLEIGSPTGLWSRGFWDFSKKWD